MSDSDGDSLVSAPTVAVLVLCGLACVALLLLVFGLWTRHQRQQQAQARGVRPVGPPGSAKRDGVIQLHLSEGGRSDGNSKTATPRRGGAVATGTPRRARGHAVTWTSDDTSISTVFVRVVAPGIAIEPAYTRFVDPIHIYRPGSYEFHVYGRCDATGDVSAVQIVEFVIADDNVALHPPEGSYEGPLNVEIDPTTLLGYTVTCAPTFPHVPRNGRFSIDMTGIHVVTLTPKVNGAGAGQRTFKYTVLPPAPLIVPGSGEITDSTRIELLPPPAVAGSELSLRYSVDGRYPTTPYNGPFFPPGTSVQPAASRAPLQVKAVIVGRDGTHSRVTEASLEVEASGCVVFDGGIPAPTCLVTTVNPYLTFDHERFHRSNVNSVAIKYRLRLRNVRGTGSELQWSLGDKIKLVADNVESVTAWAVDLDTLAESSHVTYTNWKRNAPQDGSNTGRGQSPARGDRPMSSSTLPPPSIIVNAAKVVVRWDKPERDADLLTLRCAFSAGSDGGDAGPSSTVGRAIDEHSPEVLPETDYDITDQVAQAGGHLEIQARLYKHVKPHTGQPLYVGETIFYGETFSRTFEL